LLKVPGIKTNVIAGVFIAEKELVTIGIKTIEKIIDIF